MNRVLNAGEKVEELVSLSDITVSHNPRESRRGALDKFHLQGAASNPESLRSLFVSYIKESHPEIVDLLLSIETNTLLQPPVLRAFRAKNKDGEYVQRYGIVMGEGRILAYALKEAQTGIPQKVRVRVESRITVDAAFEQGLAENLDRTDMNPVDLASAFHEMLTIRVNPNTKNQIVNGELNPLYSSEYPKGRPYTLREIAERYHRTYSWVRDHEAIYFLPEKLKLQCIKSWNEGKRNVTRFCKLGLEYKIKATGEVSSENSSVVVEPNKSALDNSSVTLDITADGNTESTQVGVVTPTPVNQEVEIEKQVSEIQEQKPRRRVLSFKAVVELFDNTPEDNTERLQAFSEVLGLSLAEALSERSLRKAA